MLPPGPPSRGEQRLARMMRPRLGDAYWAAFVAHANCHYKAAFVRAFAGPALRCVGPVGGGGALPTARMGS